MKKTIYTLLCAMALVSCEKEDLKIGESSIETQANATSAIPQSLMSVNLHFNASAYNQFFSDLNNHGSSVKPLFEKLANESLNYTSNPIVEISKTADLNNEGERLKALALQFIATKEPKYRDKAIQSLVGWAKVNKQTWHRPVETAFLDFYEAYSMLKSNTNADDAKIIDDWIRNRATKGSYNFYQQDGNGVNKVNNWEAQRICFLFYSAYILRDEQMLKDAYSAYNTFLDNFLLYGGKTKDFKDRDAFVYLAYGIETISRSITAIYNYEGSGAASTLYNKKNKIGVSLSDVIDFWQPYAIGDLSYVDFTNSIFSDERVNRKGPYKPSGDLYVLDKLIHNDPELIYPIIKQLRPNGNRFSNLKIYLSTLKTPNISQSTASLKPNALIFSDVSYLGNGNAYKVGTYTSSKLQKLDIKTKEASSIKVPKGLKVTLFENSNLTGNKIILTENSSSLFAQSFNDKMSSLIVEDLNKPDNRVVTVYSDTFYGGASVKLKPGGYTLQDLLKLGVKNDDISSLKVMAGLKVTLFQDDALTGGTVETTSDISNLFNHDFNDKTSAILIEIL